MPRIRLNQHSSTPSNDSAAMPDSQEELIANGSTAKKKTLNKNSALDAFLQDLALFRQPLKVVDGNTPGTQKKKRQSAVAPNSAAATPASGGRKRQRTVVNMNSPAVSSLTSGNTPRGAKRLNVINDFKHLLECIAEEYHSTSSSSLDSKYLSVSMSSGNSVLSEQGLSDLCDLLPFIPTNAGQSELVGDCQDQLQLVLKLCLSRLDESYLTLKQVCSTTSNGDEEGKFDDALKQCHGVLQNIHVSLLILVRLSSTIGDVVLSAHQVTSLLQAAREVISDTVMYCMSMPSSNSDERSVQNSFVDLLERESGEMKSRLVDIVQLSVGVLSALHNVLDSAVSNLFVADEALLTLCFMNVNIVIGEFSIYDSKSDEHDDDSNNGPKVYPSTFIGYLYGQMQFYGIQILQWIFARFQQHRIFLIDELLANVTKMPSLQADVSHKKKSTSSHNESHYLSNAWGNLYDSSKGSVKSSHSVYSLKDGRVIGVCSAVFLQFAQSIAEYELRQWLVMPKKDDEDSDSGLDDLVNSILNSITQIATYIFKYLLKRSFSSGKSNASEDKLLGSNSDTPYANEYRMVLEGFITDFLNVLGHVEFPASFVFVQVVAYILTEFVDNRGFGQGEGDAVKQPPGHISTSLEYLTVIFSRILEVQKKVPVTKTEDDIFAVESDPVRLLASILDYLDGTQSKALENRSSKALHIILGKKCRCASTINDGKIRELLSDKARLEVSDRGQVESFFVETISKEHLFSTAAVNNLTARLVQYLDDNNISLRIRALRSIVALMKSGAKVMEISKVQSAACARLLDGSASVRELAVELLFSVIISGDRSFLFDFYHLLSGRILDTAIAVRKKTIRCLKDLYIDLQVDTESGILKFKIDICRKLVNRLIFDNESTVKDLAAKSIDEVWFTVPKANQISICDMPCSKSFASLNVASFTERIGLQNYQNEQYEEIERFLEPNVTVISVVMTEVGNNLLKTMTDKMPVKSFWTLVSSIQLYVDYVFNSSTISVESWNLLNRLCECAPICFVRHFETIISYLQAINPHDESTFDKQSLTSILRIFAATIEMMDYDPPSVLQWGNEIVDSNSVREILPKIADMAGKQSSTVTESCIHTLNLVEKKLELNDTSLLEQMMTKCFKYAVMQSQLSAEKIVVTSLIRALFVLGLIFKNDTALSQIQGLVQEAHKVFIHFAQLPGANDGIKRTAVTALGCIWTKFPLLLLEHKSLEIVDMFLNSSNSQDENVKIQMLNVVSNFILEDEIKTLTTPSKNGRVIKDSKTLTGESQQHTESSICSSLMQRYLAPILESLISLNSDMRHAAFEVITATIRNGLIHPLQSVPYLIVLESIESGKMKDKVTALHEDLCNKYISFIHNKNMDGIRMVDDFRQRYLTANEVGDDVDWSTCLQPLYRLIRQKKQHRRTFLKQIIQTFLDPTSVKTADENHIPVALFVTENISKLEFKLLEEPLVVLQSLSKIISTAGLEVTHLFEKQDVVVVKDRQKVFNDAILLMMCMELKMYLQSLYGISDQRCQSFDANESSRTSEKPVHLREVDPMDFSKYESVVVGKSDEEWKQFVEMYQQCTAALESFTLSIDYYHEGQGTASNAATPSVNGKNSKKHQRDDDQDHVTPASRKSASKKKKRMEKTPTASEAASKRQSVRAGAINYAESSDSDFQ